MYLANLYLKSRPSPLQFFFTSQASALEAGGRPTGDGKDDAFTIVDDYGQSGTFRAFDWAAWLVIDYEQAMRAELSKQIVADQVKQALLAELGMPRQ